MRKYLLALLSILSGFGCLGVYFIKGSELAPDGTLIEPFFLLPVGYSLIALGVIVGLAASIIPYLRNRKVS